MAEAEHTGIGWNLPEQQERAGDLLVFISWFPLSTYWQTIYPETAVSHFFKDTILSWAVAHLLRRILKPTVNKHLHVCEIPSAEPDAKQVLHQMVVPFLEPPKPYKHCVIHKYRLLQAETISPLYSQEGWGLVNQRIRESRGLVFAAGLGCQLVLGTWRAVTVEGPKGSRSFPGNTSCPVLKMSFGLQFSGSVLLPLSQTCSEWFQTLSWCHLQERNPLQHSIPMPPGFCTKAQRLLLPPWWLLRFLFPAPLC